AGAHPRAPRRSGARHRPAARRARPGVPQYSCAADRPRLRVPARRSVVPGADEAQELGMLTPSLEELQRAVGDRYEVLSLAGAGGMGAVFRARHRALGHMAAVKVLPPDIAASEMRQARFKREAALAASLSHPNIVPVYEYDARQGITFLVMPFVRGRTFEEIRLEQGRVDLAAVRRVLRD